MTPRVIAIGDIHGSLAALEALIALVDPAPVDTVVTLGDYVDRGPDSRGVVDFLMGLSNRCRVVPLLGNHDAQMLAALEDRREWDRWMAFGGIATLASYGDWRRTDLVPVEHVRFLQNCARYFETPTHFFTHANYAAEVPLPAQDEEMLVWRSLRDSVPGPHFSGKVAVVGHTPRRDGTILDWGHLIDIDTGCCYGGRLTALDVGTLQAWQVDRDGKALADVAWRQMSTLRFDPG